MLRAIVLIGFVAWLMLRPAFFAVVDTSAVPTPLGKHLARVELDTLGGELKCLHSV